MFWVFIELFIIYCNFIHHIPFPIYEMFSVRSLCGNYSCVIFISNTHSYGSIWIRPGRALWTTAAVTRRVVRDVTKAIRIYGGAIKELQILLSAFSDSKWRTKWFNGSVLCFWSVKSVQNFSSEPLKTSSFIHSVLSFGYFSKFSNARRNFMQFIRVWDK